MMMEGNERKRHDIHRGFFYHFDRVQYTTNVVMKLTELFHGDPILGRFIDRQHGTPRPTTTT